MEAVVVYVLGLAAVFSKATWSMAIKPPYGGVLWLYSLPNQSIFTSTTLEYHARAKPLIMVSKDYSHACASRMIKGFALDCKAREFTT